MKGYLPGLLAVVDQVCHLADLAGMGDNGAVLPFPATAYSLEVEVLERGGVFLRKGLQSLASRVDSRDILIAEYSVNHENTVTLELGALRTNQVRLT